MTEDEAQDVNDNVADLAEAIIRLADLGDQLKGGPLTEKALVILIADKTGVRRDDIRAVLWALPQLREYVKGMPS